MSTRRWRGSRRRAFTLQLAGTGVFGGDRPRALWVGVERSPELVRLRDKIEQALIRVGPRTGAAQIRAACHAGAAARAGARQARRISSRRNAQFRAEPLPVEHFSLIASFPTKAGSVYEDQADYPLTGLSPAGTFVEWDRRHGLLAA